MNYQDLVEEQNTLKLQDGIKTVIIKIQELRDKITAPNNDGRHVGLFGMQQVLFGFGLTLHSITGAGLTSRMRTLSEVEESFTNYATLEGKSLSDLMNIPGHIWKVSILSLFHFKLDSLFQNLLLGLGEAPGTSGFGRNQSRLLNRITVPDATKITITLDAYTKMRNSIHNNGIHRGGDWGPFQFHGLTYEYHRDQDVKCASFGHVLAILDETVEVLSDILLSPEISALPTVEDRYVVLNPSE